MAPSSASQYRDRGADDEITNRGSGNRRTQSPEDRRRAGNYDDDENPSKEPRKKKAKASTSSGGLKWKEKLAAEPPNLSDQHEKLASRDCTASHDQVSEPVTLSTHDKQDLRSKFGEDYEHKYRRPVGSAEAVSANGADASLVSGSSSQIKKKKKTKKSKSSQAPRPTSEPLIRVVVNDRLGTRVEVPCLASDSIKLFKAQVAQRIGRRPHEIMLKRQGERPFKDFLTLEDYGICNGVQLDLEVDTGD